MKVINIYNHKGGVGKSFISLIVAKKLSKLGKKVVLIELDDQTNIAISLGIKEILNEYLSDMRYMPITALAVMPEITSLPIELLTYEVSDGDCSFDLMINTSLNSLEASTNSRSSDNDFFEKLFQRLENEKGYDYIIIDNPPTQYQLVVNCLKQSDKIVIPFDCEDKSSEAVMDTIIMLAKENISLENVLGVIPNKWLHIHKTQHDKWINKVQIALEVVNQNDINVKMYPKVSNSAKYKDITRIDEYKELLDGLILDIIND